MDPWYIGRLLQRRWWLLLLMLAIAEGAAVIYAAEQRTIYQSSATVVIHPSRAGGQSNTPGNDVQVLAYTQFSETFNAMAQSHSLLARAAAKVLPGSVDLTDYRCISSTLLGSAVIQISIQGPDPRSDAALANGVAAELRRSAGRYYPEYALAPLDSATVPTAPIEPRLRADILYAAAAGLLFGFVASAVSLGPAYLLGRTTGMQGSDGRTTGAPAVGEDDDRATAAAT